MIVFGIDPGPEKSGIAIVMVASYGTCPGGHLLTTQDNRGRFFGRR